MDPWAWALICLGLAFLLATLEIVVLSGGILLFLAAVAVIGSIVFAFMQNPFFGTTYTLGILTATPLLLYYIANWWPRSRMGRMLLLDPAEDPALEPDLQLYAMKKLLGKQGIAQSKMMLSGVIEVEGRQLNALSDSEPIEAGQPIIVVKVDGIEVIVRKFEISSLGNGKTESPETMLSNERPIEDPFV